MAQSKISLRLAVVGDEQVLAALRQVQGGGEQAANAIVAALKRTGPAATEAAQQFQRTGNASRNMGIMFQQAGYQVNDFFIQVSSGQNALMAFTQQGAQLLQFFGAFGVAASVALSIAGALGLAFMNMGNDADGARQKAEGLADVLADMPRLLAQIRGGELAALNAELDKKRAEYDGMIAGEALKLEGLRDRLTATQESDRALRQEGLGSLAAALARTPAGQLFSRGRIEGQSAEEIQAQIDTIEQNLSNISEVRAALGQESRVDVQQEIEFNERLLDLREQGNQREIAFLEAQRELRLSMPGADQSEIDALANRRADQEMRERALAERNRPTPQAGRPSRGASPEALARQIEAERTAALAFMTNLEREQLRASENMMGLIDLETQQRLEQLAKIEERARALGITEQEIAEARRDINASADAQRAAELERQEKKRVSDQEREDREMMRAQIEALEAESRPLERELRIAELEQNTERVEALRRDIEELRRIADALRAGEFLSASAARPAIEGQIGAEEAAQERGRVREFWTSTFSGGIRAAFEGGLGEYIQEQLGNAAQRALTRAADRAADALFNAIFGGGLFGGAGGGGGGGGGFWGGLLQSVGGALLGGIGGLFGGGANAARTPPFVPAGSFSGGGSAPTVIQVTGQEGSAFKARVQQISGPQTVKILDKTSSASSRATARATDLRKRGIIT